MSASRRSSSTLLTTTRTGIFACCNSRATCASSSVIPVVTSTTKQHHVGAADGFGRLRAHLRRERRLLAGEAGVAFGQPPAGVDDAETAADPLRRELAPVARDAGALFDDRGAPADDAVHERRLADVRAPDDRDDGEFGAHDADTGITCREAQRVDERATVGGHDLDRARQRSRGDPVEEPAARQRDVGQQVTVVLGLARERGGDVLAREQTGHADVAAEERVLDREQPHPARQFGQQRLQHRRAQLSGDQDTPTVGMIRAPEA